VTLATATNFWRVHLAYSILTYSGAAGFGPYTASFTLGALRREYVKCRVNAEVDGFGNPAYRDFEWVSDTLINITSGTEPTADDEVHLIRTMPVDELIHDFTDGAVINEINLNEIALQTIMLCQQFLDGRIDAPLSVNLDMGLNQIKNLADGTDPTDAVTLQQLLDISGNAPFYAAQAASSALSAQGFRNQTETLYNDTAQLKADVEDLVEQAEDILEDIQEAVSAVPMNNWTATTDPTVNDDEGDGYSVGSKWYNTVSGEAFMATSVSVGAADWKLITLDADDLGSMAFESATDYQLVDPRVQTVTSAGTVTPTNENDLVVITAQAEALLIANPSGTMVQGQALIVRIKDNGTARAISYGSNYRAVGVILPTTTVINKTIYLAMIWNATDMKFDVTGVAQEA